MKNSIKLKKDIIHLLLNLTIIIMPIMQIIIATSLLN